MKFLDRVKSSIARLLGASHQPQQKSWFTPYYGAQFGGTYDFFGGQKEPSKADLVKAFDDIVYACVSIIARNVSYVPIRLYVKTATGDRQPKCATVKAHDKIRRKYYNLDVREVVEHPLLDLINNQCNPWHNKSDLFELTETYLDLTGDAFWLLNKNSLGVPDQVYILPAHLVHPERDDNFFIRQWIVNQGIQEKRYSLDEVVHFKFNDPGDCYGLGKSPLRAAWGRRQISSKELSFLDNYLSNQGRPDAILALKDSLNPTEAERLAKEYFQRHQGQGSGGLLVVDGTMNLTPLSWPVKDYSELQVYQVLKTVICNCYAIPPDIFEQGNASSYASRDAAMYSFARDCLTPRIRNIVEEVNTRLVPYFDKRLFFEADEIVETDKQHNLQVDQMLVSQQVVTRDELRMKYGYPSEDWAREPLLPSGVMPAATFLPDTSIPEQIVDPVPEQDRSAQAAAVQQLQQAVYSGQLPREAGLANLVLLFEFDRQAAEALLPDLPSKAPTTTQDSDKPEVPAPEPAKEEPQPEGKAQPKNKAMRQLAPGPLIKALQTFFAKLAKEVGSKLKHLDEAETKSVAVVNWFDIDAWTNTMTEDMRPVLAAYYDHGAKETLATLNLTSSLFHTVQPLLREGAEQACMVFCEDTLKTTNLALNDAQAALKKEIAEGLVEGDVKNAMMKRVQSVFQDAETERAFRIGITESSRAQHNAMILTAKESGVVTGKTWLVSSDGCPICKPLSGKTVGLEDNFTVDGTGPYSEIKGPPRHPACRCTLLLQTEDS